MSEKESLLKEILTKIQDWKKERKEYLEMDDEHRRLHNKQRDRDLESYAQKLEEMAPEAMKTASWKGKKLISIVLWITRWERKSRRE